MFKRYKLAGALLLTGVMFQAQAGERTIEMFTGQSWQQLQKTLPRPAAVIFSTTDCGHCPAVIAAMAKQSKNHRPEVALVVVVMDGAGQPDLLREPHYQAANRLFVFHGQTAALQYSINPDWRGVTPYVALLPRTGETKLVMGSPSTSAMDQWLEKGTSSP